MKLRRKVSPPALVSLLLSATVMLLAACGGGGGGKNASGPQAAMQAPQGGSSPPAGPPRTNVETLALQPRRFALDRTYVGYLLPQERVLLPSEIEGVAEKVFFQEGDRVAPGQTLANVSTESFTIRRNLARSNLKLAESNFKRETQMRASNLIPQSQLDATRNGLEVARFSLQLAELDLAKSVVRSPLAGRIKTQGVKAGEFLRKGGLVAEILDTARMRVLINVPEGEIGHFSADQPVGISLNAVPGRTFRGNVKTIGLEAEQKNRSFPVEVDVGNREGLLRPGMLARATVNVGVFEKQVLIPRYAIMERETSRVVFVDSGGFAEERTITTGASRDGEVQVLSGLGFGDALIVKGHQNLAPRVLVQVQKTSLQPASDGNKNEPK